MSEVVTAKQIFQHLSPYDLERVTFQMPDGLPAEAVYIDTNENGGAVITVSDELPGAPFMTRLHRGMSGVIRAKREPPALAKEIS